MLSETGEPFINVARLNISKYSQQPALAKALFNYIYYHENEVSSTFRMGLRIYPQQQLIFFLIMVEISVVELLIVLKSTGLSRR